MNRTWKIPVLLALVPLLVSGLCGVLFGVQDSLQYLSAAMYPVSAGSAVYAVVLGCLRGILTLLCVFFCARAIWIGQVRPRHVVFPAVLTCLYLLSLTDPPITTAGILQACAAVLALGNMGFLLLRTRIGTRAA